MRHRSVTLFLLVFFALPALVVAAEDSHQGTHEYINLGEILSLYSVIPFVGILLSIALLPLFAPEFWHDHFGKISAFWSLVIAIPLLISYRGIALHSFLVILIADYIPFIILLWGLFTISGGILLRGTLRGTPVVNTIMIMIGTILASWMGTTGAAMLLIRPFLRANSHRKTRAFMVVFFIFLVANIGGALTPVGDPPLFLGFLHGVPFFWTFHILPHMLLTVSILVAIYFVIDSYYYRRETQGYQVDEGEKEPLSLAGGYNLLFLAGVVGSVIVSGLVDWGEINTLSVARSLQEWVRDGFIILMGILSLVCTAAQIREDNGFTWFPIKEVAYLFAGIFITMTPCLLLLLAGSKGALGFIMGTVREPSHYFWSTGALSSFLDNAPTYLTFFTSTLGKFYPGTPEPIAVSRLISENPTYLMAVSIGAVFFGANTYIGNAPNFMVRSIAEEAGTPMPSFFGYIVKYSIVFLVPVFIITTIVFF
jgi:Na+/H+ antiporter NhaD/arsenite permease-like protein